MSCISSQKNSQTGQGLRPRSPYRVVRGSIDQVRFTGPGRSTLVDRVRYTCRLRNPAQVAKVREA